MDFSWAPYFSAFWIFPLLCLLLMALMTIACRGMRFRCGGGEIGKEQYDAMRRDLDN
jgi:hypothetical protein